MAALLIHQCLPSTSSTTLTLARARLIHTTSALSSTTTIRGESQQTKKRPPPPSRVGSSFTRDAMPHEGRVPVDSERRERRVVGGGVRRFEGRGGSGRGGREYGNGSARGRERDSERERERERRPAARGGRGGFAFGVGRGRGERSGGEREREVWERRRGDERDSADRRRTDDARPAFADARRRSDLGAPTYTHTSPALSLSNGMPPTRSFDLEEKEHGRALYENPHEADEFFHPLDAVTTVSSQPNSKSTSSSAATTSTSVGFSSPPLLPGFVSALHEVLGPDATPTPIQSLSIAHCLPPSRPVQGAPGWKQFLLASETGSGKSIAYLLPLLQGVKASELAESTNPSAPPPPGTQQRLYNPRGLVLAPTHELARQLSMMAKSLLHEVKLRVVCASRANEKSSVGAAARAAGGFESRAGGRGAGGTASKMAEMFSQMGMGASGEMEVRKAQHPVGVVVGTPMKLLEMVRGRGWDRVEEDQREANEEDAAEDEDGDDGEVGKQKKIRRGRDRVVHFGTWRAKPELGLHNVEWVVVDEADVLFDPDFQETTRGLLADISAARGHVLPPSASERVPAPLAQVASSPRALSSPPLHTPISSTSPTPTATATTSTPSTAPTPLNYPFNLLLTSATIPKSLNAYLASYHPQMVRLSSPRLHKLPKSLQTEYVGWTGGRKEADVVRRMRRVWAEDAGMINATNKEGEKNGELSKILVFCNRSTKVVELAAYLEEAGIRCVAMTSRSEARARGSNRHLEAFLRSSSSSSSSSSTTPTSGDPKTTPHVLITTSLLSRGLDFSPSIKHVFIVDEPRNTVDFLHRAGRTGRAGERGKVVVFGKMKGRGSARGREVRRRVGGLVG